jgi:hypothetical protein
MWNFFEPLLVQVGAVVNPQGTLPRFIQKSQNKSFRAEIFLAFDFLSFLA